jgi:hypothetical protein
MPSAHLRPALSVVALLLAACSSSEKIPTSSSARDAGSAAEGGAGVAGAPTVEYCGGSTKLLELPANPGERGPWSVGSRAVTVAGFDAEVWFPARPGSTQGLDKYTYDLRKYLPADQQATVTDSTTIRQPCDCFRDVPLDTGHGPYAVVLFAHGFSGFSAQSLEEMVHWASRGFVVIAADHPSLGLKTFLKTGLGTFGAGAASQPKEARAVLDALQSPTGDLDFLVGHIDMTRAGAAGHSAGGGAVSGLSDYPGVKVIIPMAARGVSAGPSLKSTLVMGGMTDQIAQYSGVKAGYASSPAPKRLVGITGAGHMAFTSFCPIGADQGGILAAAQRAGVVFDPAFLATIGPLAADGCQPANLPAEQGWEVIQYATAGALEETLLCLPERAAALAKLPTLFPKAVGEYAEQL